MTDASATTAGPATGFERPLPAQRMAADGAVRIDYRAITALALPLIDCVTLMFRRWRQGKSPFAADRHHMHHMLLDAGLRPTLVVLVLGGASLLLGLGAALAIKAGVYRPLMVLVFLVLLTGWYVFSRDYDRAVARLRKLTRHRAADAPTQTSQSR